MYHDVYKLYRHASQVYLRYCVKDDELTEGAELPPLAKMVSDIISVYTNTPYRAKLRAPFLEPTQ